MKFLLLLFLAGTPSLIQGLTNGVESLIMKENKYIESNAKLPLAAIFEGCGGVVPLSPIFETHVCYKLDQLFEPYEFCVWTLVPGDQVTNVRVVVWQNMTDPWDGITLHFLNSTGLTSLKLGGNDTEFNFNTPLAFLVFSSSQGIQSNGFYFSVYSTGGSGLSSTTAYHVQKDQGNFSYPIKDRMRNGKNRMALTLQRETPGRVQTHLELNLENVRIDEGDAIQVYSFNTHWMNEPLLLIGSFTSDDTFQVHSFHPVLILLDSQSKNLTGKGFQVEWKKFPYSIK